MKAALAAVILALSVLSAQARPSPYPPVTQFVGDRYGSAQLGADVANMARCPPPACQRKRAGKARHLYPTRKRPPVSRQKWRHVPIPAPRPLAEPGTVEPLSVAGGAWREARAAVIGGRPAGCPHRFCGCALSLHLFGKIVTTPNLNQAVTWARVFPRAHAAPGMVAARSGHVFKLLAHVRGSVWRVWDANSGRGRIRIHDRSIVGYSIVNPHGGNS